MSSNTNSGTAHGGIDNSAYINSERSETSPLYSSSKDTGNLNFIIAFFSIFTVLITLVLAFQINYGDHQIEPHGSVASDSKECSQIGISILKKGGNAIDASIATALCIGVILPHLTGVGGGGLMLIYNHRESKVMDSIDFRVTKSEDSGIGVPGFLAGLALAHQLHGTLPWETLVAPSVAFARAGFPVTPSLIKAANKQYLQNSTHSDELKKWLEPLKEGEVIQLPKLALLLESVAKFGPTVFYNHTLKTEADILSPGDIDSYQPTHGVALKGSLKGFSIITSGNDTGGYSLHQALPYLDINVSSILPFTDAFKEDSGASWPINSGSHIAVADINDIYVSIVSGFGSVLGSQIFTPSEYILNNAIEVLDNPTRNALKQGEKVPTLAVPIIATDSSHICARRLIIGSSDYRDGAQALLSLLNHEETEKDVISSIEATRVRVITPLILEEKNHSPKLSLLERKALESKNYKLLPAPLPYPSINVIQKVNDLTVAYADTRGYGQAVAF